MGGRRVGGFVVLPDAHGGACRRGGIGEVETVGTTATGQNLEVGIVYLVDVEVLFAGLCRLHGERRGTAGAVGRQAQAQAVLQAVGAIALVGERPTLGIAVVDVLEGDLGCGRGGRYGAVGLLARNDEELAPVCQQVGGLHGGRTDGDDECGDALRRHVDSQHIAVHPDAGNGA